MVSSFGQRFGAKLLFLSLFNQLVMRSFCFSFAGSRFVGHCRGVRKQPSNVRCFSGLDDLMGEVDQLLSDLSSGNKHTAATASENDGWTNYDWTTLNIWTTKPSPVEERMILGRRVFVKRDDLLRLRGSNISGNKARKMLTLNEIPADEFPECLVSYGGPQSNSMLALAAVINYKNRELVLEGDESCFNGPASTSQLTPSKESADAGSTKEKRFVYYTKKLPRFLRNQPSGNLFRAKTLGMELIEVSRQEYNDLFDSDSGASPRPPLGLDPPLPGNSMWVRTFAVNNAMSPFFS